MDLIMYAIYSGLGGSFGGKTLIGVEKFENYDQAMEYARGLAIEDYQSYEGMHGLLTEEECEEEGATYEDELDSWLDYDAIEITEKNYKDIAEDFNNDDQVVRIYKYMEKYLDSRGE